MSKQAQIGRLGENIAADYLEKNNYKILVRNWRHKFGELDIICQQNKGIIFVEVKTMKMGSRFGEPLEKVNYNKLRKLQQLGELFLIKEKYPEDTTWQIDVISIELDYKKRRAKLAHIQDA